MASFDEFISSIIADGNDGKAFELFCKRFLETAPEYKDQFEKVWLWDQWPKKWSHDCPSSYKMGHQSGLNIRGSGSYV